MGEGLRRLNSVQFESSENDVEAASRLFTGLSAYVPWDVRKYGHIIYRKKDWDAP